VLYVIWNSIAKQCFFIQIQQLLVFLEPVVVVHPVIINKWHPIQLAPFRCPDIF